jgi:hypothetical protein
MIVEMTDEHAQEGIGSTAPGNAHQVLLSKMLFDPGNEIPTLRPQDGRHFIN